MTLVEFLLARIAEDEEVAGALPADGYYTDEQRVLEVPPDKDGFAWPRRWSPVRVLAECEAKRQIVQRLAPLLDPFSRESDQACPAEVDLAWDVLDEMTTPYADHPDYRPEWRP